MINNLFDRVFGSGNRAFLPVIHVRDRVQAVRNSTIAFEAGADGVFLIDMRGRHPRFLLETCAEVHDSFPDSWIGVNMLGHDPEYVFDVIPRYVRGVWSDYAGTPGSMMVKETLWRINEAEDQGFYTMYFGGVAHKASPRSTDDALVAAQDARRLCRGMHVVTTSGSATGTPASINKLRAMVEAIGDKPLAVASGADEKNVRLMLEVGVRAFLVASSIEVYPGSDELDLGKTRRLAQIIHAE